MYFIYGVIFILSFSSTFSFPYITKHILQLPTTKTSFPPHTIIIWVHGTRFIKSDGFKTIFKKVPQLKKPQDLISVRYYRKIMDTFNSYDGLAKDNLYFFGWSGKLCNKKRKKSALYLYNEIVQLKKTYERVHNTSPTLIVIGHSHGGNVILHMAAYHQESSLALDTVLLLACPAQEIMYRAIQSPLFKKLYSLYSYRDIIQILAPNFLKQKGLSLKNIKPNPFSKRVFPLQSNLIQSRVVLNGNGPRHNDFVKKPFLSSLPTLLTQMETWTDPCNEKRFLTFINTTA